MHHPRGLGPPPLRDVSGGLQRAPSEPPCGLRLTAPRQPYDISRPKNSKDPKTTTDHQNDSYTPPFYNCKPTTANTEQGENTGLHSAPYGEAAQAPSKSARQNLMPELPTIDSRPRIYSAPTNTATKKFSSIVPLPIVTHRLTTVSHA